MRSFWTLLVLASLAAAASAAPGPQAQRSEGQRIAGGSVTAIAQYPTVVALLYTWNSVTFNQNCVGTIINNRSVLTAAHCTFNDSPHQWVMRVGSTYAHSGGVLHTLALIINHPAYTPSLLSNDIGLLRSATTFTYNNYVQPVSIAGPNYSVADNQPVWAAGWGRTSANGESSEQLRHVQVWTINQATCRARHAELGWNVTDSMLCSGWLDVGGRDACPGDAGAPLYHNGVLVGSKSWGYECAHPRYPGLNARISYFTTFIQDNA